MNHETKTTAPGARVYIGSLSYVVQSQEVRGLVEKAGFALLKLDMSIDPFTGRNSSYGFVDVAEEDTAARSISELGGRTFVGRPLKLRPATKARAQISARRESRPSIMDRGPAG